MPSKKIIDLDNFDLLTCILVDEADGEPILGHLAILQVILNRVVMVSRFKHLEKIWGKPDAESVVTHPQQFSCYNKYLGSGVQEYIDVSCCKVADWGYYDGLVARCAKDNVALPEFSCDTYCRHDCWPIWRQDGVFHCRIGNHVFVQLYDKEKGHYISQARILEAKAKCCCSELSWLRPFLC